MKTLILLFVSVLFVPWVARAGSDLDQIEQIFHNQPVEQEPTFTRPGNEKKLPVGTFAPIQHLEPYHDIAVITRTFLPTTDRFETSFGTGMIVNDAFFDNPELSLRVGFHFTEQYSAELSAFKIIPSAKSVTDGLQNHGVHTASLVTPLAYYGADFKWTPFYGKVAFLNRKIIHFYHYFTLGGGETSTNNSGSAPTLHLGTGEIFAINKSWAFRWDLDWMAYSVQTGAISDGTGGVRQNINNIYVTLGFSYFFPGATYR